MEPLTLNGSWKVGCLADNPLDVSTEDSGDSSTSPSSSKSADGDASFRGVVDDKYTSSIDYMKRYGVRQSSLESMSVCGWDFLLGKRKPRWHRRKGEYPLAYYRPVPELYVDGRSFLELIHDVTKLKRGDHCVIVLNVFRTFIPFVDHVHSWLSGYGYFKMYHHFIVLDDVVSVDSNGIPRNEDGIAVEIMEYSNTASQFLSDAKDKGFMNNIFDKAKCRRVALIDYGDNGYFYRFVDSLHLTNAQRDSIVQRAIDFMTSQPRYHIIHQNCEHTTNLITMKNDKKSELVHYVWRNLKRYTAHIVLTTTAGGLASAAETNTTVLWLIKFVNVLIIQIDMLIYIVYAVMGGGNNTLLSQRSNYTGKVVSLIPKPHAFIYHIFQIIRFIVVSVLSFVCINDSLDNLLLQSSMGDVALASLVVSHSYWLSDTIMFNTLINLYAGFRKYIFNSHSLHQP